MSAETSNEVCHLDAVKELLNECENIWKQMEEIESKLMLLEVETRLQSDATLSLLIQEWKALTVHYQQWHIRSPEIISTNPDVLLELGKDELQKLKNELEMVMSTVLLKNKQLEEDLRREQKWFEAQEQQLDALNRMEEESKMQAEQPSKKRGVGQLQNQMLKLKTYREKLLSALGEFLDKHFPLPQKDGSAKSKNTSAEPTVELLTMRDILQILINKLLSTPHEPYITINESFWPPYIELLLRYGMALRHPEDPNRMRLEAYHK